MKNIFKDVLTFLVVMLIVFFALTWCGRAKAGTFLSTPSDWTTNDTLRQTTYEALHLVDLGQTLYIADHPNEFTEANSAWAIGAHPSKGRVYTYFVVTGVGNYLVAKWLPSYAQVLGYDVNPRAIWQSFFIVDSAYGVAHNNSIGIKIEY
jgi:hypothetical protein